MSANIPPRAKCQPHTSTHHGHTLNDAYHWLRADNWQEVMHDPSVLAEDIRTYLEAENTYTAAMLADTDSLQDTLFAELKGRIKEDDSTVPAPHGPYDYAMRYEEGQQQPMIVRTVRETGEEQILLDANRLADGTAYFRLGIASHSPDHTRMVWSADTKGSEYYTLTIRDLTTGDDQPDVIPETTGGAAWSADSRHIFYTRVDANHRPSKVYLHTLGTDPSDDVLIYEESDPGFFVGVHTSQSGDYVVIDSHDHETAEVYLLDAHAPTSTLRLVAKRETGVEYSVAHHGDMLYLLTNRDGAEDFKIMRTAVSAPEPENWQDYIPHTAGTLVLSMREYANHLVRLERKDGLPRIVIHRLSDGAEHVIAFDEEAYSLGMAGGYEFDTNSLRFSYSSMTTPSRVYDYDMETHERTLRKEQEIPSGHVIDDYTTRRIMAPSHDGTLVPVSLLHHKDTKLDGSAPCLLYGYGSYGFAIPASFSTNALSLVDRGFVYAIAHIRGGSDKGDHWYKTGRREHKVNTFKDFIAAGDHLIAENYTSRGKIIAQGGSAGGMLMGAVANMAPDLFDGIIAEVPFVDVLNTMLDDTLPLTPPEWPEWGNPLANADDYAMIASYSPYDNIEAKDYPAILAVGGLTDPRVTYWEPAKWVARLRATKTDANMLLLKTNMDAGHGGASGRFDRLKDIALNWAFALKVSGRLDSGTA